VEAFTVDHVQQALDHFNFGITIKIFEQSTATSQLAADAIGCQLGQIAKSICFLVEEQPVLAVMSGDQLVDDRKIAAMMNVGRKKVRLAKAEDCLEVFGYMPGGVPPLGHRTPMSRVFLDHNLQRYEVIYAAGGTANAIFPLTLPQLETVTGGVFVDVARESVKAENGES
jgi:prolyl-tRNA editing enzyme YbaK/EbsC (Cys-tRNA(Pro) deacylase)